MKRKDKQQESRDRDAVVDVVRCCCFVTVASLLLLLLLLLLLVAFEIRDTTAVKVIFGTTEKSFFCFLAT